jgi:hypothetical protein
MNYRNKINFFVVMIPFAGFAQDTHYWGNHYGAGGFFVPGSVIAYTGDSAVLFYNPALLVHAGKSKISVSATAYYFEKIKVKNGAGNNFDLQSVNGGSSPLLVAGNIQFKKNPRINIAYGLISEPVFDFHVSQRRDEQMPVLDESYSPGPEYFVAQMKKQNTIRRFGAMAGMGFSLSKNISAGFYVEAFSRRHRYEINFIGRALVNPPGNSQYPLVSTDLDYSVNYSHFGLKGRLGVAWDDGPDQIGLTFQTPLVRISGSGTIVSDMVINNGNFLGFLINQIANTRQEKLEVAWKDPFSVSLGYSRQFHGATVYAAAEYFPSVDEYNIVTPRDEYFIRPDTGNNFLFTRDILRLKDARRNIWNFSAGGSFVLSQRLLLFAACRTDHTYFKWDRFKDNTGFIPYTATWNLFHVQTGLNMKMPKYTVRAGLYTAFGGDGKYVQDINFDNPTEGNFLQGELSIGRARYFSAGFLLSYIHNF